MANFDYWIFKRNKCDAGGEIEVRIGRGPAALLYNPSDPTKVIEYTGLNPVLDISETPQSIQDEDADLVSGETNFTVRDRFTYQGISNGVAVSGDYRADTSTLFNSIFDDSGTPYYLWLTHISPTGARWIYFAGDIDYPGIDWDNAGKGEMYKVGTANEVRISHLKITAYPIIERAKKYTVGMLRATLNDAVTGPPLMEGGYPFYNGYIPHTADPSDEGFPGWDALINQASIGIGALGPLVDAADSVGIATPYDLATAAFPAGSSGIKLTRILDRIANDLNFHFDPATDLETAFYWYIQYVAGTPGIAKPFDGYSTSEITVQDHVLHFNYLFSLSPTDGQDFSSASGYSADTPITEMLKGFAFLLGCYIWPEIDQSDGKVRMRLLSRTVSRGTLPPSWNDRILETKELQWMIGKTRVEVKNKGDETTVVCPDISTGDALQIEIPFRVREWGNTVAEHAGGLPVYEDRHMYVDTKASAVEQFLHFIRYDGSADPRFIADGGWLMGSYIYYTYPRPTAPTLAANLYYQGRSQFMAADYNNPATNKAWEGFYALRACTERHDVLTNRGNTLVAQAQLYARECIGPRLVVETKYAALFDDTGSMATIQCNIETTFRLHNAVRTWRAMSVVPDVASGTTTITWVEKIDYAALGDDIPYRINNGGAATSGGAAGGGSGQSVGASGSTPGTSGSKVQTLYADIISTANIASLSTATTAINGTALTPNMIVFLNGQTAHSQNGPWVVPASGAWGRPSMDPDKWRIVVVRLAPSVTPRIWEMSTTGVITVGTSAMDWVPVTANPPSTAVTPGSYTNTNLTIGQDGRVTAASNGAATGVLWRAAGALVGTRNDLNVINSGIMNVALVDDPVLSRMNMTFSTNTGGTLILTNIQNRGYYQGLSRTISGSGTVTSADFIIEVDTSALPPVGGFAITLPAANAVNAFGAQLRWIVIIQDIGGLASGLGTGITVIAAGTDTINGGANKTMTSNYGAIICTSDGVSKWRAFKMNGA